MRLNLYDRVRLTTSRFLSEGVPMNAVGYIIALYDDGNCEIEFSDDGGITYAQVVVKLTELERDE